jgi:hypothetical protein
MKEGILACAQTLRYKEGIKLTMKSNLWYILYNSNPTNKTYIVYMLPLYLFIKFGLLTTRATWFLSSFIHE